MTTDDLIRAIGDIDDDLVEGSEAQRSRRLSRVLPAAAALVLAVGVGAALMLFLGGRRGGNEQTASASESPVTEAPAATSDPAAPTIEPFLTVVPTLPPGATEVPGWEGTEPAASDYVRFTSAEELAGKAQYVVRARIVDSVCVFVPTAFRMDPEGNFVPREDAPSTLKTIYGIQVLEVYKGGEAASRITRLMVPGGTVGGVVQYTGCPDYAQYGSGGECVLFLNVPEISETWIWSDIAFPVGFSEDRCDIEYDGSSDGMIKCRFPEVTFEWLRGLDAPTI